MSRPLRVRVPGERTPYLREDLEDMLYFAASMLSMVDPQHQGVVSDERLDLIEYCRLYEESLRRKDA